MKRNIKYLVQSSLSLVLVGGILFNNVINAMAFKGTELTLGSSNTIIGESNTIIIGESNTIMVAENRRSAITTPNYVAELDFGLDKLSFQYSGRTDGKDWNNGDVELAPSRTVLLDKDNNPLTIDKKIPVLLDNITSDGGVAGMILTGDVLATKSYFFFDDEIMCLGAGVKSNNSNGKVAQVVDNINLTNTTRAFLTNPNIGYRTVRAATTSKWNELVDKAVKQKHTKNTYLAASGYASNSLDWRYLFTNVLKNSNVSARISTGSTGKADNLEIWAEPLNDLTFNYTLAAGGDFKAVVSTPKNTVISNTQDLQAAENISEHKVMVNKWTDGKVEVLNSVANMTLNQASSVTVKTEPLNNVAFITISKPTVNEALEIEMTLDIIAESLKEMNGTTAMKIGTVTGDKVHLILDTAQMDSPITIKVNLKKIDTETDTEFSMIKGDSVQIEVPKDFKAPITWSTGFLKYDGTLLRNAGSSKKKYELQNGETDGTRKGGDTSAEHLITLTPNDTNALLIAKNTGNPVVVAKDSTGKQQFWKVHISYEDPANLPVANDQDFARIRQNWLETLVGSGDISSTPEGAKIIADSDAETQKAWDSYDFKGQDTCHKVPWSEDIDVNGNPKISYENDAVEFRPAFIKLKSMSRSYAMQGSKFYKDPMLLKDIINILDYMFTKCYVPKTHTDNWWTWEIGLPADILPTLIMLYDDLTAEQIKKYTDPIYFFQPDPFNSGIIGTATTHAQGYRSAEGANITNNCSTAIGLGALRHDSEQVYLGMLASSQNFIVQEVEDSTQIVNKGYLSGFYPDGSYLDHGRIPYMGSYGNVFLKDAARIPGLLAGTPWKYSPQTQKNLELYVTEGYCYGIYRGMMLDNLKGRSVSRPTANNVAAGREAMVSILKMLDSFSQEAKDTVQSSLKTWMQYDIGFIDSLKGISNILTKKKAQEILNDPSIKAYIPPVHRTYPFMDRAIHRTDDYLFALSMYSERIQNTEIMNHENRYGWHHGNGMTYIYDDDNQYTENYWNTVNPLRLPGTTVASVNIGNGSLDGSGFAQSGDFCSDQSWVGGTLIGNRGINGMAFSGVVSNEATTKIKYAPNLSGKKSWFIFDDEIVCLGAGITNSNMNVPVETTIENRKINSNGTNTFLVDGVKPSLTVKTANIKNLVDRSADVTGTLITNPKWAHIAGTKAIGTGYYFPENITINAHHARTTGNWSDIGTTKNLPNVTQDYLEMWIDHGKNPTDATYSYVLLPEKTTEQTKEYSLNSPIEILSNTKTVQAVKHSTLNITGINFWTAGQIANIACDKPASVMLEENNNQLKIAVSDPTMKETGKIKITLTGKNIIDSISLDSNVTFNKIDENTSELIFEMAKTNGATSMAILDLPEKIHEMTYYPEIKPTCEKDGHIEYWHCTKCGKNFADAEGTTEITKDVVISAIGHNWNLPVYEWLENGSECTAQRICKNDLTHKETAKATVTSIVTKRPTETTKGETTYTAKFAAKWATTQTKVLSDIPMLPSFDDSDGNFTDESKDEPQSTVKPNLPKKIDDKEDNKVINLSGTNMVIDKLPEFTNENAKKFAEVIIKEFKDINTLPIVDYSKLQKTDEYILKTIPNIKKQAEKAIDKLNPTEKQKNNLRVVVQYFTQIELIDAKISDDGKEITDFKVNLTPMAQIIATFSDNNDAIHIYGKDANAVKVGDPQKIKITETLQINIPLIDEFVNKENNNLYIEHIGYVYQGEVKTNHKKQYLTFENPDGFSEFTVSKLNPAIVQIGNFGYLDINTALNEITDGQTLEFLKPITDTFTINREVSFNVDGANFTGKILAGDGYTAQINNNNYLFTKQVDNTQDEKTQVDENPDDLQNTTQKASTYILILFTVFIVIALGTVLIVKFKKYNTK